jgi:hypothetical protein
VRYVYLMIMHLKESPFTYANMQVKILGGVEWREREIERKSERLCVAKKGFWHQS